MKIKELISAMTLEEKAGLCSGMDFWHTKAVDRLGIKPMMVSDGLPDSFESEGYDRSHMRLPECQNELIKAVCAVNKNVVVVLHNGSPVEMPWIDDVSAVLEMYLGGQAVGGATVNLLFGKANPSGHLAETFPLKLEDNPSYLYYTGEGDVTEYREGVFVGYRYYDKKKMPVLFPFGHGLSYTEFRYSGIKLSRQSITENDLLTVTAEITNTGKVAGKEVVQLYVGTKDSDMIRPVRELKAFEKVYLEPGQTKTVIFTLDKRAFSYFDMGINDWFVESKDYEISLGSSSRDLRLCAVVAVKGLKRKKMVYTADSTFGDVAANPANRQIVEQIMAASANSRLGGGGDTRGRISGEMMAAMLRYMPLRGLALFGFVDSLETVDRLVEKLNRANN